MVVLVVQAGRALPDVRLLFLVNVATLAAVVLFAAGVVYLLLRRNYQRRVEEQKLTAIGTATARILHQVKNPLQTIVLHADLLDDPVLSADPEPRAEITGAIAGEAHRLAAMLEELSVYASGARRDLALEPVPAHQLMRELARKEARDGRVAVDDSRVREAGVVMIDPYYLRQALENLISNARDAMAGQPDARLALAVERRAERVVFEVADSGPGIPPERLETIFDPFVSSKTKGMGLGLAVCREIVESHGGRIEVHSRPGEGARFRILLPRHASPDAPAERTPR